MKIFILYVIIGILVWYIQYTYHVKYYKKHKENYKNFHEYFNDDVASITMLISIAWTLMIPWIIITTLFVYINELIEKWMK